MGALQLETVCSPLFSVCVNVAGASMGDPRGRPEAQHDGGGAGAVRAQQTGGSDRVAPHQQRHPLQRWLRLQGTTSVTTNTSSGNQHSSAKFSLLDTERLLDIISLCFLFISGDAFVLDYMTYLIFFRQNEDYKTLTELSVNENIVIDCSPCLLNSHQKA